MMNKSDKIYIAGHQGLVGSAIVRLLRAQGYDNLLLRSRREVDLTDRDQVFAFFADEEPQWVFLAAAKVGGIYANDAFPADFIRDNLLIELNVIEAAWRFGSQKLQFLGSSCIYPKLAPQAALRELAAHRPAGADERMVRDCQNRGRQAVPGLPQAARLPGNFVNAHKLVWAGR